MNPKLLLAAVSCLFLFSLIGHAQQNIPQPKVDERVELLAIVFRLGGAEEYQVRSFTEYDEAIQKYFAPFKEHPVIRAVKSLRSTTGVSYDAVMNYAVRISIENGHVIFPDADSEKTLSEKTLDGLDSRWRPLVAQKFAKDLDDFYVKSRFNEFFESNREMYQKTIEKIKEFNDKIDYSWFKKFYGEANLEHFHIILANTNENSNYGASCRFKDGHEECFAIIGARGPNGFYNENSIISLVIHEFNHSFCNPHIEKHFDDLKPAAERVLPFVADILARQAYSSAKTMWYEYLVRACEIRYALAHGNKNVADKSIEYNRSNGFLWMAELVELLGRYENERDKYPTLAEFMPEIVKMQNAIVTDEYVAELRTEHQKREEEKERNRPKIAATSPPNGATDVDPAITEISVTFDRPMDPEHYGWCRQGPPETFPKYDDPTWDDDNQTMRARNPILQPGKTYEIWFNAEWFPAFRSTEGSILTPVRYTFTTRAE
jgi:hypothetical protein